MTVYRRWPAQDLRVETISDLRFVFHRMSGQTHVLAPEVDAILELLAEGSLTEAQVEQRLTERFQLELDGGSVRDLVHARLQDMVSIGLVEASDDTF